MTAASTELKSCCAAAYSTTAARFLLGDSFHPGGSQLTSRLIRDLGVGEGSTVVDVASGLGTSALQLAHELGCDVVGVELSPTSVAAAADAAAAAGLSEHVRFVVADAEALPLDDASMDAGLCECAFCTFPERRRPPPSRLACCARAPAWCSRTWSPNPNGSRTSFAASPPGSPASPTPGPSQS